MGSFGDKDFRAWAERRSDTLASVTKLAGASIENVMK